MNDENNLEPQAIVKKENTNSGVLVAIIIAAWIVGISVVIAGVIISKEIAKNNSSNSNTNTAADPNIQRLNISITDSAPYLGNKDAKVTIVEFADFQCPFCNQWQQVIFPLIKKNYIDTNKVKFVFLNYPFLGAESFRASEAARCAQDQNKFWEYHDKLYASQSGENEGAFADANLKQFAKDLQLDTAQFNTCFDSGKYVEEIKQTPVEAGQYLVESTPTIFINGLKIEGMNPFQTYSTIIETELAK